ncbi:MAG: LPS export ABC transporter periplasmic protein LptC [Spirochaetota bacterium]|nr:MAG: LPS export ABC transporter periplasmic protein LptC [Spirochaetota bacterium]
MRISLIFVLTVMLFFFALLFPGYGMKKDVDEVEDIDEGTEIPDYILHDVIHFHYEEGSLKVKVNFEKGNYYNDQGELRVENCQFVYYDIDNDVVSRGSSDRAKLYSDDSKLVAEENVVVISEENKGKLETEYLEWHGNDNQFTSDRFVKITQENGDTISGVGLIADVGLKRVTIKKDVKGSFKEK